MSSNYRLRIVHWLETPLRVHRFLFTSFFLLLFSIMLSFVLKSDTFSRGSFEGNVRNQLSLQIKEKHKANELLKSKIRTIGFFNFDQLSLANQSQYVFKDGNLVFWGDNHFSPEHTRIKSEYPEKYIELKSGKFLAIKDTLKLKGENFEIINLLPLFYSYDIENRYVAPGPNLSIFEDKTTDVNNYQIESDVTILNDKGNYLFSVHPPLKLNTGVSWLNITILIFGMCFLTSLSYAVWYWIKNSHAKLANIHSKAALVLFFQRNEADYILLFLLVYTVLVRLLLLAFRLPSSVLHVRFFNSNYYGWQFLLPSPGDLLLHFFFATVYLLAVKHLLRKTWLFHFLNNWKSDKKMFSHLLKAILVLLSHSSLFWVATSLSLVFDTLKLPLDLLDLPMLDASVLLCGLLLVVTSAFFWGIARMAYELRSKNLRYGLLKQYLPALIVFLLFTAYYTWQLSLVVVVLHLLLFGIAIVLRLPSGKHSFDYAALVFFSLCATCCAAVATFSLGTVYPKRDQEMKINFLSQQLIENNLLGENLLHEIAKQVVTDHYIANTFQNPMFQAKDMEEKVRRFYLGNYLNRYDIQVLAFDGQGSALSEYDKRTLGEVRSDFSYKLYKTNYPDIYYYITQQNQLLKNYLSIVPIFQGGLKTGTILIDMQLKKFIPNSILPVLLVDKKGETQQNTSVYSYAVFNNGEMTNSFGNFNFRKDLVNSLLSDSTQYTRNQSLREGFFLVSNLGKGRKIIVQSDKQPAWETICNFSFMFILMELALCFFFASNLLVFNFDRFFNSLTFKIQLYSVLAFFIPVGLVSSGVLVAVITSYNQELQRHFKDNASNIAYALSDDLQKFHQREKDLDQLNENVLRIARLYNTDINIYRRNGMLLASSSPILFRTGLISNLISPKAYYAIRQAKNKLFLQEENIGKLHYNHVYVQVRSSDTGEELGIISIPFFASGQELSERVTNTLKIILNIATLTFMVFLFFSFMASNFITYPLKLITHRIRKTTLDTNNTPLNWESKDELGLLIREYNLMLQKLDQNKRSLALTQKESAWREVAQQVAHEIKNPLTPIKLSLQHMRRIILNQEQLDKKKMDQTFDMIIQQVETLDEIASSFSIYAKMPTFTLEEVVLQKVIQQVLEVYVSDKKEYIHFQSHSANYVALADEKMLGRILANLLLNAFQAIPSEKTPYVSIEIDVETEVYLIRIKDNGIGIAPELGEKVFEPHFSTKFSGSGIGLYIAKKGIDQMGGEIGFESFVDQGTSFWIRLKRA